MGRFRIGVRGLRSRSTGVSDFGQLRIHIHPERVWWPLASRSVGGTKLAEDPRHRWP
jgi:hypothetical protein